MFSDIHVIIFLFPVSFFYSTFVVVVAVVAYVYRQCTYIPAISSLSCVPADEVVCSQQSLRLQVREHSLRRAQQSTR